MLNQYTVLFAEDEEQTRKNIGDILSMMCKKVLLAKDGKEALELYLENSPDLIILDIEMPNLSGLEVCKKIREVNKNVPIIISTAYTDTEYFLQAVELNLTKYILKPITAIDLKNALEKCVQKINEKKERIIQISDNIYYNFAQRALFCNEEEVFLRKSELNFLEYLLDNPNRLITYEEFEINIWEEEVMSSSAIRSLIRDIRKHLPKDMIINIAKLGYKLVLP